MATRKRNNDSTIRNSEAFLLTYAYIDMSVRRSRCAPLCKRYQEGEKGQTRKKDKKNIIITVLSTFVTSMFVTRIVKRYERCTLHRYPSLSIDKVFHLGRL